MNFAQIQINLLIYFTLENVLRNKRAMMNITEIIILP